MGNKSSQKKLSPKAQKQPMISVIVPSYNQGRFLERTLLSIINQDCQNYEIIIMDGGSTDKSVEIIKKYAKKYPDKILWKSEKDKGQTDAINKGLKLARGDILAYLNSDDTYAAGAFSTILDFFARNPDEDIVHGIGHHIDENDNYICKVPSKPEPADSCSLYYGCVICQPATYWRRKVFEKTGFFSDSLVYGMDYDYWIRISRNFKIPFIEKHLANYRLHDASKTVSCKVEMSKTDLGVIKKNYGTVSIYSLWGYAYLFSKEKLGLKSETKLERLLFFFVCVSLLGMLSISYRPTFDSDFIKRGIAYLRKPRW